MVIQEDKGVHVMLRCLANGHPKPTISWYFDQSGKGKGERVISVNIDLGGNTDRCGQLRSGYFYLWRNDPSDLVICSPDYEKHQGKYRCHASNKAGSADKYAFLTVQSRSTSFIEFIKSTYISSNYNVHFYTVKSHLPSSSL